LSKKKKKKKWCSRWRGTNSPLLVVDDFVRRCYSFPKCMVAVEFSISAVGGFDRVCALLLDFSSDFPCEPLPNLALLKPHGSHGVFSKLCGEMSLHCGPGSGRAHEVSSLFERVLNKPFFLRRVRDESLFEWSTFRALPSRTFAGFGLFNLTRIMLPFYGNRTSPRSTTRGLVLHSATRRRRLSWCELGALHLVELSDGHFLTNTDADSTSSG
jgi:hypothetical protein